MIIDSNGEYEDLRDEYEALLRIPILSPDEAARLVLLGRVLTAYEKNRL